MTLLELLVVAVGVSIDAFSIAVCKGLSVQKLHPRHAAIVGAYFGGFQALMPVLGYAFGSLIASLMQAFDHWLVFGIFGYLGVQMIREAFQPETCPVGDFSPKTMIPLSIADSIDAFAVGITFAMIQIRLLPAVTMIGLCTFLFSFLGVYIGHFFGERFQKPAGIVGGLLLVFIGIRVLVDHLIRGV